MESSPQACITFFADRAELGVWRCDRFSSDAFGASNMIVIPARSKTTHLSTETNFLQAKRCTVGTYKCAIELGEC